MSWVRCGGPTSQELIDEHQLWDDENFVEWSGGPDVEAMQCASLDQRCESWW